MNEGGFPESTIDELRAELARLPVDRLRAVVDALQAAAEAGRTVFVFGNGGSAATASHFANDLTAAAGDRPLRAVSLTDNVPLLTALANDYSFADVFSRQLARLARPGDVVVALSGSSNSANVVRAVRQARELGATTVGILGFGGGELRDEVDLGVTVASCEPTVAESLHSVIVHLIANWLRRRLAAPA